MNIIEKLIEGINLSFLDTFFQLRLHDDEIRFDALLIHSSHDLHMIIIQMVI